MPVVLLTGFEPFDGETVNPSWQAVQLVRSDDATIVTAQLPVDFDSVDAALLDAIHEHRPDIVICVGQAGGRSSVDLERVAINVDDARIPDNAGFQPIDEPIVVDGPAAYFSTLPIKAAVAALTLTGIPSTVSQTAGTYTCNHVFYTLMHSLPDSARGGFVHVPFSTEQAGDRDVPSLPLATIVEALGIIVETSISTTSDLRLVGGAIS